MNFVLEVRRVDKLGGVTHQIRLISLIESHKYLQTTAAFLEVLCSPLGKYQSLSCNW